MRWFGPMFNTLFKNTFFFKVRFFKSALPQRCDMTLKIGFPLTFMHTVSKIGYLWIQFEIVVFISIFKVLIVYVFIYLDLFTYLAGLSFLVIPYIESRVPVLYNSFPHSSLLYSSLSPQGKSYCIVASLPQLGFSLTILVQISF